MYTAIGTILVLHLLHLVIDIYLISTKLNLQTMVNLKNFNLQNYPLYSNDFIANCQYTRDMEQLFVIYYP